MSQVRTNVCFQCSIIDNGSCSPWQAQGKDETCISEWWFPGSILKAFPLFAAPGQHLRRLWWDVAAESRGSGRCGHCDSEEPPVQARRHLPHHDHHDQHDVHPDLIVRAPAPPVGAHVSPPSGAPPAGAGPGGRPAGPPNTGHLPGRHAGLRRLLHGLAHRPRRPHVGHQPHAASPPPTGHEHASARSGLSRLPGGRRRRSGARSAGAGVVRWAVQTKADQTRGNAGGRGRGPGQPQDPRGRMSEPEYHLQVRVPDAVSQQHGGPETHPGGLAGWSGAGAEREDVQTGDLQRGRQETETHFHRGPGEALPGGLLRRAAEALVGEDRSHSGEAGPEKKRGPSLVLQSEAKAETNEVFCHALRAAGSCGSLPRWHKDKSEGRCCCCTLSEKQGTPLCLSFDWARGRQGRENTTLNKSFHLRPSSVICMILLFSFFTKWFFLLMFAETKQHQQCEKH